MTFRGKWWKDSQAANFFVGFLILASFGVVAGIQSKTLLPWLWAAGFALVPVGILLWRFHYVLEITINQDSLRLKRLVGSSVNVPRSDISRMAIELIPENSSVFIEDLAGNQWHLRPNHFVNKDKLIYEIKFWLGPNLCIQRTLLPNETKVFRQTGMSLGLFFCFLIVLAIVVSKGVDRFWAYDIASFVSAFVFGVPAVVVLRFHAKVSGAGLEVQTFNTKFVTWDEIESVTMFSHGGKSSMENTTVKWKDGKIVLAAFDNYLFLRDLVLGNVSPSIVEDRRQK